MEPGSRPSRPRGVLIAALLLLTLALAGAIALQAYRNFLGHKATAERVLHDYARLAAARFANRTEMSFYYDAFSPAADALMRVKAGDPNVPLPPPSRLPATTQPHAPDFLKLAHYTFRYDLRSGRLETSGAAPSTLVRKWLRDTMPVQYAPTFAAQDSFEHPMMGGIRVKVALRPDVAPKLAIGGMPRSNLPMLLSLLAVTAGLVVMALLQLHRENELSRLRVDFVS